MISAFCGPYTINIETGPVYIYLSMYFLNPNGFNWFLGFIVIGYQQYLYNDVVFMII